MIKKQRMLAIILAALALVLGLVYFLIIKPIIEYTENPTMNISVLPGEYFVFGPADASGEDLLTDDLPDTLKDVVSKEKDGTLKVPQKTTRQYMFKQVVREGIQSIEVVNQHGSYKFFRNAYNEFQLDGYLGMMYDENVFAYLVVAAGTTTFNTKITDHATEADLVEFGLDKPIAHWTVTTTDGEKHTVYLGSNLLNESGYYAMYEGRDAIYILNNNVQYAILQPVETLISPYLTAVQGLEQNNYFFIDNFTLWKNEKLFLRIGNVPKSELSNPEAIAEARMIYPEGYTPHDSNYYNVIYSLGALKGSATVKVGTDTETLDQYGLLHPAYALYFSFEQMEFYVYFSEKQADGTYYASSNLSNFQLITKIDASEVVFLEQSLFFWVKEYPFSEMITEMKNISIKAKDVDISFDLFHGKDENGNNTLALEADVRASKETPAPSTIKISEENAYTFRQFYRTLLAISFQEYSPLSEEEKAALLADKDKLLLTFTTTSLNGETTEYSFYQYSTRRAFVTINGYGEFYTYVDLVTKAASDVEKVLLGIDIESYAKN